MKFIFLLLPSIVFAVCVHEKVLDSSSLKELKGQNVYVETSNAIYKKLIDVKIIEGQKYKVQIHQKHNTDEMGDYDSKYLKYYTYKRMQDYLLKIDGLINSVGMQTRVIGKSIEGRDLYAVTPKKIKNKKTILMFGRHHGDEGTANWIIEGFFNKYLSDKNFRDEYQLILYPMINPDGAVAHSRYNSKGRDLNRSWHKNIGKNYDEIKVFHKDLRPILMQLKENIFITLDMHGSFSRDFIYRVRKNYVSREFYDHQQKFIDELAAYDTWQNGTFIHSNGDKAMSRIVLIDHYKVNAMTHESIKNIPLDNDRGRSVDTLIEQGVAIKKSISNLY